MRREDCRIIQRPRCRRHGLRCRHGGNRHRYRRHRRQRGCNDGHSVPLWRDGGGDPCCPLSKQSRSGPLFLVVPAAPARFGILFVALECLKTVFGPIHDPTNRHAVAVDIEIQVQTERTGSVVTSQFGHAALGGYTRLDEVENIAQTCSVSLVIRSL